MKSPKEVTKQKESRFFLLFLLDERRIRIRKGPKTCGSGGPGYGTLPGTVTLFNCPSV
jgi:hypothetical protein